MSLETWVYIYSALGLLTGVVVGVASRRSDPVSSEGSELFLAIPAFLIWPVIWVLVVVVLAITTFSRETAVHRDTELTDL